MRLMRRLIRNLSLGGACAGALLCGAVAAQPAGPGSDKAPPPAKPASGANGASTDNGPLDITGDKADKFDDQHMVIYSGNVQAVQNGARLDCDVLHVYFDPAAPAPGATGAAAKPAANANSGEDSGFGQIRQAVADGHVFYVTQTQTIRAEHGVYDAAPDTVTMTGDVVVVQGKNVQRGDKMIMDIKTGHTQVFSNVTGRNKPGRVRGVFYSENQNGGAQPAPAQGQGQTQTPSKPAASTAPASKP
jgi:lipopolysaccharide export system protein LptA